MGVIDYGDGLPVNTIIFTGSNLPRLMIPDAQSSVSALTVNGNTVTVVLVDPNIGSGNYKKVDGLNVVVWSDPATTISDIQANMKCGKKSESSVSAIN